MYAQRQVRLIPYVLMAVMCVGGTSALAGPYFEIQSLADWQLALDKGNVIPMTPERWDEYMVEWALYTEEGESYPSTTFLKATLYPYEGSMVPPDPDPDTAGGLVMAWGDGSLPDGSYASAWRYDYQVDPDLTNTVITLTVFPPNGIAQISFGIQDMNGNTRSWFWNVGPGQTIPWNVNTQVTIFPSQWGLNATVPPADGFMNNPGFDVTTAQFFVADENGVVVGGQVPIPPPGGPPVAVWNYWDDIVVRPGVQPGDYLFEFSVDIGSDAELSDPQVNGNEAFDPGDVYWWQSAPVVPPGRDGFKDDLRIFHVDPFPDPPDPAIPPATRVPVGMGDPSWYPEFFDLDGHDQIDFSLLTAVYPVIWMPSQCIHKPAHLMISQEDDMAPGWPANDVPVTVPSASGMIYGTTPGQDEVIGVNIQLGLLPPFPVLGTYPIADELTVHQSLFPNPDFGDPEDDDVDSLDIVENEDVCPFWYFSADHEATFGLNPGAIYEVTAGGPVQVINGPFHLGIPAGTDIDAFEFAWLEDPTGSGQVVLVLLYSVDEDDPLTAINESGGMNPATIYYSMMTGVSWVFCNPLPWWWDDVDALTIWRDTLEQSNTRLSLQ